jgi:LAS superfamily LD-carboxypeptidase LdcB
MNIDILLGKTTEHLAPLEGTKFLLHKQMLPEFIKLARDAKDAGFNLQIASAFRNYERQCLIWNMKASGERPIHDEFGNALNIKDLSPQEIMFAILRWSALPGSSRHHWGSDIDVFDGNTQEPKDVKLIPSECEGNGPASKLHEWLDLVIAQDLSYGFYRPYRSDRGGVAPERWHLSYYPISRRVTDSYTFSIFKKNIEQSDLKLKDELLENSFEIYERFFLNTDLP